MERVLRKWKSEVQMRPLARVAPRMGAGASSKTEALYETEDRHGAIEASHEEVEVRRSDEALGQSRPTR